MKTMLFTLMYSRIEVSMNREGVRVCMCGDGLHLFFVSTKNGIVSGECHVLPHLRGFKFHTARQPPARTHLGRLLVPPPQFFSFFFILAFLRIPPHSQCKRCNSTTTYNTNPQTPTAINGKKQPVLASIAKRYAFFSLSSLSLFVGPCSNRLDRNEITPLPLFLLSNRLI